jgi:membrane-bound metal-dependent hydrolase YbcI (DUF457 family)
MNTVSHALAPVILTRLILGSSACRRRRHWLLIGLGGALPDLLNPHLSLEARMTSWSHGLPFWMAFSLTLIALAFSNRQRVPLKLAVLLSLGYFLHLICDAISGGINWLYPTGDWAWGAYWINPVYWVPLDIFLLLVLYALFRRPLPNRSN